MNLLYRFRRWLGSKVCQAEEKHGRCTLLARYPSIAFAQVWCHRCRSIVWAELGELPPTLLGEYDGPDSLLEEFDGATLKSEELK